MTFLSYDKETLISSDNVYISEKKWKKLEENEENRN